MKQLLKNILAVGRLYGGVKGAIALTIMLISGGVVGAIFDALGGSWGFGLLVTAIVVVAFYVYFSTPAQRGIHTPRYLRWYALPIRRVSWEFDNYLAMSAREGSDLTIAKMQFNLRVNYGSDLAPIEGYVISLNTGQKFTMELKGPTGYLPISSIERIPAKTRIYGHVVFAESPLPDSEFLRRFSGFDFRLKWNGSKFERRFSRSELGFIIDNFRLSSNPEPPRRIVAKDTDSAR